LQKSLSKGREIVQVVGSAQYDPKKHDSVEINICEKYVDIDFRDIPKEDYIAILGVTGRPWRFVDFWGSPWKIIKTGNPSYPYRWLARPGTEGKINY
tara:strand:- start:18 stop:308 length:291 start_codon:yes stop_codon:yes gene_type:complete